MSNLQVSKGAPRNPLGQQMKDLEDKTDKKFSDFHRVIVAVVVVLVVAVITMLVMVIAMVIDSLRFNSMIYMEYAENKTLNTYLMSENGRLAKELRLLGTTTEDVIE
ncbi:hypothetical protein H6786_05705 [Candidatus Nomurabacteria bacterium]|nr:hypothetical protein [Candidatus Nomurabacteria bacterium]